MPKKELQKKLLGELIGIVRAVDGSEHLIRPSTDALVREVLAAVADPAAETDRLNGLLQQTAAEKQAIVPGCFVCAAPCGRTSAYDMSRLESDPAAVRTVKEQLLQLLFRAAPNGLVPASVLYPPLFAVGMEDVTAEELQSFVQALETALAATKTTER